MYQAQRAPLEKPCSSRVDKCTTPLGAALLYLLMEPQAGRNDEVEQLKLDKARLVEALTKLRLLIQQSHDEYRASLAAQHQLCERLSAENFVLRAENDRLSSAKTSPQYTEGSTYLESDEYDHGHDHDEEMFCLPRPDHLTFTDGGENAATAPHRNLDSKELGLELDLKLRLDEVGDGSLDVEELEQFSQYEDLQPKPTLSLE